jgi:uracil-DNA glycosylase
MQSLETLENLNTTIRFCDLCRLAQSRTHAVPGEGASDATLMFVGEAPGKSEDAPGRPFVGRGGQVLERSLADLGQRREQVFITNIVKCRRTIATREPMRLRHVVPILTAWWPSFSRS